MLHVEQVTPAERRSRLKDAPLLVKDDDEGVDASAYTGKKVTAKLDHTQTTPPITVLLTFLRGGQGDGQSLPAPLHYYTSVLH